MKKRASYLKDAGSRKREDGAARKAPTKVTVRTERIGSNGDIAASQFFRVLIWGEISEIDFGKAENIGPKYEGNGLPDWKWLARMKLIFKWLGLT